MALLLLFKSVLLAFITVLPDNDGHNNHSRSGNITGRKDVEFGLGSQFAVGFNNPSVAILSDSLIAAAYDNDSHIYQTVGSLNGLLVDWQSPNLITKGTKPQLTADKDNLLLLVYSNDANLHYRSGLLYDKSNISWSRESEIGPGSNPSVSLSNSTVVLVYNNSVEFIYRFGRLNSSEIQFENATFPTANSCATTVISLNNRNQIVEASQLCDSNNNSTVKSILQYRRGMVTNGYEIIWTQNVTGVGKNPSISVTNEGVIVELHVVNNNNGLISGTFNDDFEFKSSKCAYEESVKNPKIDCNNDICIQVHQQLNTSNLRYSVSYLVDRHRWMQLTPTVLDRPLWQLTLPGSHDSGSYYSEKSPNVMIPLEIAQNCAVLSQLQGGVRFLDLRPQWDNGSFYAYHLTAGPEISEILDDIRTYLDSVEQELIVLEISHFDFGNSDLNHIDFVNILIEQLHKYLVKVNYTSAQLITTPLKQLIADGPKVLIIYQDSFIRRNPIVGIWPTLGKFDIFNSYADSDDLTVMERDQLGKLISNSGDSDRLFLLSYTLTQQISNFFVDFSRGIASLRDLAQPASRSLGKFLVSLPTNLTVNVIFADFFDDAKVTDWVIWMNKRR